MSNEFVMVPRVPTDEMIVAFSEAWYSKRQCIDDPDMLDAYAAMLAVAPDHHGEPVAWLARAVDADGTTYRQCVSTNKLTERDAKFAWGEGVMNRCSVVITPLGPLADPGEVERLRSIERSYGLREALLEQVKGERDRMIARTTELADRLAERDALLRDISKVLDSWRSTDELEEIGDRVAALISASAETSAPKCKECGDTGTIDSTEKVEISDGLYVERGLISCTECEEQFSPAEVESRSFIDPQGVLIVAEPSAPKDWCTTMERPKLKCGCPDCGYSIVQMVDPSAPVERDERAEFESAYPGLVGRVRWDEAKQEYRSGSKGLGWQEGLKATEWLAVWQARAALERKP